MREQGIPGPPKLPPPPDMSPDAIRARNAAYAARQVAQGERLPTRAESLALTREQVADLTARWPVAGIKLVLHPFLKKAFLEFRFTMPTPTPSELLISLDYGGGARRYDVLDDARWQLACTVFDLGYPTRGEE